MTIVPFAALRPRQEYARDVGALPYDVMNAEEALKEVEGNPNSFLHVDKAEIDLPAGTDPYNQMVYDKARENLQDLVNRSVLAADNEPCLYIYRLIAKKSNKNINADTGSADIHVQTGLVACVSVEEYEKGLIKRHEFTRPDKELDRVNHIKATNAHTGPIFMAYRAGDAASEVTPRDIISNWINSHDPVYDILPQDKAQEKVKENHENELKVRHMMWKIDDPNTIQELIAAFKKVPSFYIADGHHRNEAARKVANQLGTPESQFYLATLFPHDELAIMDYNRVVTGLSDHQKKDLLTKTQAVLSRDPISPDKKGQAGMYMKGQWYRITLKGQGLDVDILQKEVLSPLLGIHDPKTDKRIDFVGGIRGLKELEKRVDSGEMDVAFSMYPTSMEELMAVADAGEVMPPKSTWFEPKLLSGLLIHTF